MTTIYYVNKSNPMEVKAKSIDCDEVAFLSETDSFCTKCVGVYAEGAIADTINCVAKYLGCNVNSKLADIYYELQHL